MKILIFFFVIVFHSVSFSDEIEMVTDRPDQTESANIVVPGWIQIETGVVYKLDSYENIDTEILNLATTLLRVGVVKNAELRFAFQYTSFKEKTLECEKKLEGIEGVCVGTKIHIVEEDGWIPETSFLYHMRLPVGAKEFRADEITSDFG
ncbi:transporter [Bacteroidota bacterium]